MLSVKALQGQIPHEQTICIFTGPSQARDEMLLKVAKQAFNERPAVEPPDSCDDSCGFLW